MKVSFLRRAIVAIAAVSLVACAGGGGSSPVPRPVASSAPLGAETSISFTITFPATAPSATTSARKRQYVSQGLASLSIGIAGANNFSSTTYVNAPAPPLAQPQTITTVVPAPPGDDTFTIGEYDQSNGKGDELGSVVQTVPVKIDTINNINLTVNGELASIVIQPSTSPFIEGSLAAGFTLVGDAPQTFNAVPLDAKGYTIVSPGLVPAITETSATPTSIVATMIGASNTFVLQAPAPTGFIAITATGSNLESKTVTTAFNVDALGAFYVADYTIQRIRVFDENGTPLLLPATQFPGLQNPMGIAYVPGTTGTSTTVGTSGSIVVTQTSNYVAPFVARYDQAGNAQTLANSAFPFGGNDITGNQQPLFLSYGGGKFWAPDFYSSTISVFDPSGNAIANAAGTYTKLLNPVASTYDPDNGFLYVTNLGNDTITSYDPGGTLQATATTGSHPMGIAYDAKLKQLYVAYGGTLGGALNAPSSQAAVVAGIDVFTPALATVAETGGFSNTSATAYFTGMAFDPYLKQVYAADAGSSKIDAFTETGGAVTLPAGAFGSISPATAPPGDPMAIQFVL